MCDDTEPIQYLAPGDFAVAEDGYQVGYPWRVTLDDGRLASCLVLPRDVPPGATATVNVSSADRSRCMQSGMAERAMLRR